MPSHSQHQLQASRRFLLPGRFSVLRALLPGKFGLFRAQSFFGLVQRRRHDGFLGHRPGFGPLVVPPEEKLDGGGRNN